MGSLDLLVVSCSTSARNSEPCASPDGVASLEDSSSTPPSCSLLVTKSCSGASTSLAPVSPLDSPSASSTLSLLPLLPCQEPTCSSVESPSTLEVSPTNSTSSNPSKTDLSLT